MQTEQPDMFRIIVAEYPGTLLDFELVRFKPHWACIGHVADPPKFSATMPNQLIPVIDSRGKRLHIHSTTPAPPKRIA